MALWIVDNEEKAKCDIISQSPYWKHVKVDLCKMSPSYFCFPQVASVKTEVSSLYLSSLFYPC